MSGARNRYDAGKGKAEQHAEAKEFDNLRWQMYWQARIDLEQGVIGAPDDEEFFADLTTPQWKPDDGKIRVESKKEIRKRLGRSPNKGTRSSTGIGSGSAASCGSPLKIRRRIPTG